MTQYIQVITLERNCAFFLYYSQISERNKVQTQRKGGGNTNRQRGMPSTPPNKQVDAWDQGHGAMAFQGTTSPSSGHFQDCHRGHHVAFSQQQALGSGFRHLPLQGKHSARHCPLAEGSTHLDVPLNASKGRLEMRKQGRRSKK